MQQRAVLDDERVGLQHGLAQADGLVVERQKAITGVPMRSEPKLGNACAWRPSRNAADRKHLGPGDDALAAAAMDTDLEQGTFRSLERVIVDACSGNADVPEFAEVIHAANIGAEAFDSGQESSSANPPTQRMPMPTRAAWPFGAGQVGSSSALYLRDPDGTPGGPCGRCQVGSGGPGCRNRARSRSMDHTNPLIAGVGLAERARKSRWPARLDLVQSASGLILALFMWGHMFFVSSDPPGPGGDVADHQALRGLLLLRPPTPASCRWWWRRSSPSSWCTRCSRCASSRPTSASSRPTART